MKLKKNELIGICLIGIFSFVNIFSIYISEFIITRKIEYDDLMLMYQASEITSTAINFSYLGLIIFTIFYFFIYKEKKEK